MASKDAEIRKVSARLEGLLDDLQANVDALSAILVPPASPETPDAKEMVP